MSESIQQAVQDAGIVGAGGAGFPTHVKFGARVDTVIANGAECEPLLRCDKAVMRARADQVVEGLRLLAEATGAKRSVVALKAAYPDVVECVRRAVWRVAPQTEIHLLDNFYPAGDEQVLVHEVTGRVIPESGIPLAVDVVVNNVLTLSQVAAAVHDGSPVTRRTLTVAGEVARPLTCELPVGAPMSLAVELAGGATVSSWSIVEGGPMMGRVVLDPDEPITKKTSGVLVLPSDLPMVARKQVGIDREKHLARAVCCQCRMCTDLCPRFNLGHAIEPHRTMRSLLSRGLTEPTADQQTMAYLCCLCGACEAYACTLGLSPRKVYEDLKGQLGQAKIDNPHHRDDCAPTDFQVPRRIPVPRLIERLGLGAYAHAEDRVQWSEVEVPVVTIPLQQHVGVPAFPVVEAGQSVREGDLIGEIPEGKLGARVHASIAGTVGSVDVKKIRIHRS